MKKILIMTFISWFGLNGLLRAQDTKCPDSKLNRAQENMVMISALTAKGDLEKLGTALNMALDSGLTVNEVKEILVHLYAYCGFPRSLRGLQTFMNVLDERKARGIADEIGRQATPVTDNRSRYERGEEIQMKVTRRTAEQLNSGYAAFSPEIAAFLKEHLFADLFERDILSFSEREIVTVSALISMGGVEPMVRSHFNASLNVGVTEGQLRQLVSIVRARVGEKEAKAAQPILEEVILSRSIK